MWENNALTFSYNFTNEKVDCSGLRKAINILTVLQEQRSWKDGWKNDAAKTSEDDEWKSLIFASEMFSHKLIVKVMNTSPMKVKNPVHSIAGTVDFRNVLDQILDNHLVSLITIKKQIF